MGNNSCGTAIIKKIIFPLVFLYSCISCGTLLLPPMEVASCQVGKSSIVVEFTLAPDRGSLEKGLSVTEDGAKMEGHITVSGKKAEFTPLYGIKENYDYVVRIEAGTEDVHGHSLMDTFVYEYSTRNKKSPFSVEFLVPQQGALVPEQGEVLSKQSLEIAAAEQAGGEMEVLQDISMIQLEFSQPVDKKSLEGSLNITPSFGYFLEYGNNDRLVSVIPQKELESNQRYVISLAASVMDIHRNTLTKEAHWSFFYKKDVQAPEFTFHHTAEPENLVFAEENPPAIIAGDHLELGLDDWIVLEFSEKIPLDEAPSYIFLESAENLTIAPSLEIILDYKNGTRLALRPEWTRNSGALWGSKWRLVVKAGIPDKAGNKTAEEKELVLSYTLETQRPPVFLGAMFVDSEKQSNLKACFSPDTPFLSLELDPQFYPNRAEELPSTVDLHLFFALSRENPSLNLFSLMEQTSLSASNDCCELTLKKLISEDAGESCNNRFQEFTSELERLGGSPVPAVEPAATLVMVGFQVELLNGTNKGLITLELGEQVADALGNTLGRAVVCQVNKL